MGWVWQPTEPITDVERGIDLAAIQPLYESWWAARADLGASSPETLKKFTTRLVRRLSVETGILERLYDLDRGTTEALVAKGFAEDLVSRSSTDIEPARLIEFLQDQEAAIQLVMACVGGGRELAKSVLHELHADRGDLAPLARLLAGLERTAILQALSIDADAELSTERSLTSAVIASLANRFNRRAEAKREDLRQVNSLARELRSQTRSMVQHVFSQLREPVALVAPATIHVAEGGPDQGNAHWYKHDVIKSTANSGKYVNFSENHYFIKATIRAGTERLVFVTSLHHVGRELSGIMELTTFARLESFEGPDDRELVSQEFSPCSLEPFVITWKTAHSDIEASYSRWLDAALAIAMQEFGDRL